MLQWLLISIVNFEKFPSKNIDYVIGSNDVFHDYALG